MSGDGNEHHGYGPRSWPDDDPRFELRHDAPSLPCNGVRVGHVNADRADGNREYVGRDGDGWGMRRNEHPDGGWLGNPFTMSNGLTREEAIEGFCGEFVGRLVTDKFFRRRVGRLHGDVLLCYCRELDEDGSACHADVIAAWAARIHHNEVEFL